MSIATEFTRTGCKVISARRMREETATTGSAAGAKIWNWKGDLGLNKQKKPKIETEFRGTESLAKKSEKERQRGEIGNNFQNFLT